MNVCRRALILGLALVAAALAAGEGVASEPERDQNGRAVLERHQTKAAKSRKDGLEYVFLPSVVFEMGCVPDDACEADLRKDERPRHHVQLTKGFWIGRTEVTLEAFRRFVAEAGRVTTAEMDGWSPFFDGRVVVKKEGMSWRSPGFDQGPNHPVVVVSWCSTALTMLT